MKALLLTVALAAALGTQAATLTDSFTDGIRNRTAPAEDVPASTALFTETGQATGVSYQFLKVGSKTYTEDGEYVYYYKMDQSVKGAIYNTTRPSDTSLFVNEISLDGFKSGTLRVYGCPQSSSAKFCYSGYSDNPQGDHLGNLTPDRPSLKVYGEYAAIIIECDPVATGSCIFHTINFTWGAPLTAPDDPEDPAAATWEISDLLVISGPYNSTNRDAYLTFECDLTYTGTEAASIKLSPKVVQGVAQYDFLSLTVDFDGAETKHIKYKNTLTGSIACELGKTSELQIQGANQMLYQGPITVCNYSPKFTSSSALNGATDVKCANLEVPLELTCTQGPYRGYLECLLYPGESCTSGTSLARVDLLQEVAAGETVNVTFAFPDDIVLEPDHTYGFSFWRTKANGADVKIVSGLSFTTTKESGIEEVEASEEAAPAEYFNLQGQRIAQPEAGVLHIRSMGGKAQLER